MMRERLREYRRLHSTTVVAIEGPHLGAERAGILISILAARIDAGNRSAVVSTAMIAC
jgi:hypothetical protein